MKKNINKNDKNVCSKSGIIFYKKHTNNLSNNRGICCMATFKTDSDE